MKLSAFFPLLISLSTQRRGCVEQLVIEAKLVICLRHTVTLVFSSYATFSTN